MVEDTRARNARRHSGRRRVLIAVATGVVAFAVAFPLVAWQVAVLIAWDVAAVVVAVRAWSHAWGLSAADTQTYAMLEDTSRTWSDLALLAASLVSLVGVASAFVKASDFSSGEELATKLLGILTILLSWIVVHTIYAFRYASTYYAPPVGGIDFKSDDLDPLPDYRDFAYVAFTVGMTYQVADTDVTQRAMRHVVLRHALLSFLFGAVILATTVNLIAGLLNG